MSYDAIVIGAGPAGATAALLLARAGWSVAIVEKSAFPRRKVCGEFISAPALGLLGRAGVDGDVLAGAGPEVREVAVYAGDHVVSGEMPRHEGAFAFGRALGREHLDSRLLAAAERAGAKIWQPWRAQHYRREGQNFVVHVRHEVATAAVLPPREDTSVSLRGARRRSNPDAIELQAPIVIAAHGSWDTGGLEVAGTPSELLAFKAHFTNCDLPPHRMPLVAFPGGYGGLVTTDDGRVSFSCCISRSALAACRADLPGASASAAVLAHVLGSTRGMRESIGRGSRAGAWLAAGPLRPGIHSGCGGGCFTIGNAHGEAHPIVAEGISMAVQSAWLLCERLIRAGSRADAPALDAVARDYERAYRTLFGPRIVAAAAFAALASRRVTAGAVASLLDKLPPLLSFGARWAGKTATFPADLDALHAAPTSR